MLLNKRASGLLLHLTSLPSLHGIGDLGPEAYRFADFLVVARQQFWQILPLNPVEEGLFNSPYSSASAFAGNILLISLEELLKEGLLQPEDLPPVPPFSTGKVDYQAVRSFKEPVLQMAYQRFFAGASDVHRNEYAQFCQEHAGWLDDFALFTALHHHFPEKDWSQWPVPIRDHTAEGLTFYTGSLHNEIEREKFWQFLFYRQWFHLKKYCAERNIHFIGDLPIYVHYHSADVWANPQVFKLNADKKPSVVAGVPPDYFSETGQLWGNPVYDWDYLGKTNYEWWVRRVSHNVHLLDVVRMDHFLGFVAYWEVDAREKTALNGKWVEAPVEDFFQSLFRRHPNLPIIAEDLGIVTPAVKQFMERHNFPGMRVLMFAFGDNVDANPYAPHNHVENCVVYTGTHDNNTTKGWFIRETDAATKQRIELYTGQTVEAETVTALFIRMAMQSVAKLVILPVQDVLNLGEYARMNMPGTTTNNWAWRLEPGMLTESGASELAQTTQLYGRS